jgi:hypothetical protein
MPARFNIEHAKNIMLYFSYSEKFAIFHVTNGKAHKNHDVITHFPHVGLVMFSQQ